MIDAGLDISIVIPTLNEEADVVGCLEAVAAQTFPLERTEVIVVDGCSSDRTAEVAMKAAARLGLDLRVIENTQRRTSTSLNVGLEAARGAIVVRLDARSRVQSTYVERCVQVLADRSDVGVVGGRQVPMARSSDLLDRSIVRALSNRYTTGLSRYRRTARSGPTDTVWMGVFRTEQLRKLGGWAKEVALNEDWELNSRFRGAGLLVWFVADLTSGYLPRQSLSALARQHFRFGRVKGMWWARGMRPAPRQLVLLAGPMVGLVALAGLIRRLGPVAAVAVPGALLAMDAIGSDRPAGGAERVGSGVAIATYSAAWWAGTIVGAVGEVAGVEHRLGSVPA